MKFTPTPLAGAFVVTLEPHTDDRGSFARSWCAETFAGQGLFAQVSQCNISFNTARGTLRGLHYQTPPHGEAKFIRCTRGALYDVIVDLRPGSASRGRWFGIELDQDGPDMLYIPEGFAHGFVTLRPETEIFYMMSTPYIQGTGRGIRWDDPTLAIGWPLTPAVISGRDRALPLFDATTGR